MTPEQQEAIDRTKKQMATDSFSTQQQIAIEKTKRKMEAKAKVKPPEIDKPWYEDVSDVFEGLQRAGETVANYATFGLADKVAGAGEAAKDYLFGDDDVDLKESYYKPKRKRQQWERENPYTSFGLAIPGSLMNPVAGPAAQFIGKSKGLVDLSLRSGLTSGLWSGTQALGESEGTVGERAGKVGKATAMGGAVGTVIPGALKGIGWMWNQTFGRIKGLSDTAAVRKLYEAAERDGLTRDQLNQQIKKKGLRAAVMDGGDNLRTLGYQAGKVPGKGKKIIKDFVETRQKGTIDPVTKDLEGGQAQTLINTIDDLVPDNFLKTKAGVDASAKAGPHYEAAYKANQSIDDAVINRILKTPEGRLALKQTAGRMGTKMKNLSKVDKELTKQAQEAGIKTGKGVGEGLKMETLDGVKRRLQGMEGAARRSGDMEQAKYIGKLRRDLADRLDDVDLTKGEYAKARQLAGEKFDEQAALDRGVKFMKKGEFPTPEALNAELQAMSPAERHLFRVGVVQQIKTVLGDSGRGQNAAGKFLENPALIKKMKMGLGDAKTYRKFMTVLENEADMYATRAHLQVGSRTAENVAALKDTGIDPDALIQAGKNWNILNPLSSYRLGKALLGRGVEKSGTGKITGPMSDRLAGMLVGRQAPAAPAGINDYQSFLRSISQLSGQAHPLRDAALFGTAAHIGGQEPDITLRK